MAFEIPKDLIQNVQSLLRIESGLSNTYDHHDPSVHPLPSHDASISELAKLMPDNSRCRKCEAKFLRGTQSLICIYCGSKIQIEDNLPDPISFNSSSGCQWLLHSLDLDQSVSIYIYIYIHICMCVCYQGIRIKGCMCMYLEFMYNVCIAYGLCLFIQMDV